MIICFKLLIHIVLHTLHHQADLVVGDVGWTKVLDGCGAVIETYLMGNALDGLLVLNRNEVVKGNLT